MSTTLDLATLLARLAGSAPPPPATPAAAQAEQQSALQRLLEPLMPMILAALGAWLVKALAPRPKPVLMPGDASVPNPNAPGNAAPTAPWDLDDVIPPGPAQTVARCTAVWYQGQLSSERFGAQGDKTFRIKQDDAIPWDSKVWGTLSGFDGADREFTSDRARAAGLIFTGEWEMIGPGGATARIIGSGWDGVTLYTAADAPNPNCVGKPVPKPGYTLENGATDDIGFGASSYLWSSGFNFQGKVRTEGKYRVRGRVSPSAPWSVWTEYTVS